MWRRFTRARRRDAATALIASVLTTLASGGIVAASAATPQAPPRNEQAPTISGVQRVGSALTGNPGMWSGPQPITFTYQWISCTSQLANCRRVDGDRRYTARASDQGRRLIFHVEARNRDGARTAQATTGVIGARATAPRNVVAPSLSGTAREGQVLTANPGTWSGTAPIAFTYQWQRCDSNGNNCATIAGATARTYGLVAADVGSSVRAVVRARNDGGNRSLTTPPSAPIQSGGPGGQIQLPGGKVSIPIESVTLPAQLVIDEVRFSPNPVRSRTRPFVMRVHVVDTRGFVVRGALAYARSTPLLTTVPRETATGTDGWATLRFRARSSRRSGLVFPLRRGLNVQFYVQARKSGERLQFGVTASRLVQVGTARP
jgi:hypothetical protein